MNEAKIRATLKSKGLSYTRPRKEILHLLMTRHGPFSVEDILKSIPDGTCDQATVYRCISQFLEKSLIKEVRLGEDFSRYEFNHPDHHHHHVICKSCQKIDSIDNCFIAPFLNQIKKLGYTEIEHALEFFAICPKCQKA